MAITILVEPQEFQSVYNEVIVVFDSDNRDEAKFQYVVDVNINGVYSSRLKIQSNPEGYGIVNLSRHLQSAISSNIPDLNEPQAFNLIQDSFKTYDITLSEEFVVETSYNSVLTNGGNAKFNTTSAHGFLVGEGVNVTGVVNTEYDGFQTIISIDSTTQFTTSKLYGATSAGNVKLSADVPTITEDVLAVFSETKYIANNVSSFIDVIDWNGDDYLLASATTKAFLTNLPINYYSRLDDNIVMNIRNMTTNVAAFLKVITNLGTYYFPNQHAASVSSTKFLSVKVGAGDFFEEGLDVPSSSSFPMFNDASESYTVQTIDSDPSVSSEIRTFTIDRSCTKHENTKLLYLNSGGSFSPFNFAGASQKTTKVKKRNYQQAYGSYNSTLGTYGHQSYDAGSKRLSTDIKETWKLNSTWLPESVGDLIEDLIISPQVFKVESNGSLRAIEVKTSSIKIKKQSVKKLVSYSLDIEMSTNNSSQK